MPKGAVKWFNRHTSYGFIGHNEGRDIFVHSSSIQTDGLKPLIEDRRVRSDIKETENGSVAGNVFVIQP